jgi:hypothetical protein
MNAKRRYSAPPDSEADQWCLGFEDVDDEYGHTTKGGVPVWNPKAEHDELFRHKVFRSAPFTVPAR